MKSARLAAVISDFPGPVLDSTDMVEETSISVDRKKIEAAPTSHCILAAVFGDDELMKLMINWYEAWCSVLYQLSEKTGANVLVRCTPKTEWFFVAHVLLRAADLIVEDHDVEGKSYSWLKSEFLYRTREPLLLSAGMIFVEDCVIQVLTDTIESHLKEKLASMQADLLLQQAENAHLKTDFSRYKKTVESKTACITAKHKQEKAEQKAQYRKNMKYMRDKLTLETIESLSLPELKTMAEKSTAVYHTRLESDLTRYMDMEACVVCLQRPKTIMMTPCNHFCMCAHCAESVMAEYGLCPICMTPDVTTMRVY